MKNMIFVFIIMILLNMAFVGFVVTSNPKSWYVEVLISLPISIGNCVAIYWFVNGGKFK